MTIFSGSISVVKDKISSSSNDLILSYYALQSLRDYFDQEGEYVLSDSARQAATELYQAIKILHTADSTVDVLQASTQVSRLPKNSDWES